jgi:hypothetical protein
MALVQSMLSGIPCGALDYPSLHLENLAPIDSIPHSCYTHNMERCRHLFTKRKLWLFKKDKYICINCSMTTRHYDSVDGMMNRPIHPYMSVALNGANTVKRNRNDALS